MTVAAHIDKHSGRGRNRMRLKVNGAVISHIGCVRGNNEDNCFADGDMLLPAEANRGVTLPFSAVQKVHLFAVCDGMGGLAAGEQASNIATNALRPLMKPLGEEAIPTVDQWARGLSEAVRGHFVNQGGDKRGGTTLALLHLQGRSAHIANVGDSRVYLLRKGYLAQISCDHSAVYQLMLSGQLTREQMRKHPAANVISCYLGMPKEREPDPFMFQRCIELKRDDRFLLCSDGLSDLLPHEQLQQILRESKTPLEAVRQLVTSALRLSGKDNVTAMVLDVRGNRLPPPETNALAYEQRIIPPELTL